MSNQYKGTTMLEVEEATRQILECASILGSEQVSMLDAAGRVLSKNLVSDIDIAPFDNSAMDGFAVRAANAAAASEDNPVRLKIVGILGAGQVFGGRIEDGEALRIMTGAPMPAGVDTVIKIEDVEVEGEMPECPEGTQVVITKAPKTGKNVRMHGEETRAGEVVLKAGTLLNAAGVGLLASTGNTVVEVYCRPRVAVLSSGNELVDPSEKPGPGQIRNSNCYSLAAAAQAAGAEVHIIGRVNDDFDALCATVKEAVAQHDMVVISGGAAQGDFDFTGKMIDELGTLLFSSVNMRPGKAQTLGIIDGTIVFGLAGNPSAAMVGFEVLLRPALRAMQGAPSIKRPVTRARLTADTKKSDARRMYMRATVVRSEETGEYLATPDKNQSSALLGSLQSSNCLVVLPEGLTGSLKDELVDCLRLDINEGVVV